MLLEQFEILRDCSIQQYIRELVLQIVKRRLKGGGIVCISLPIHKIVYDLCRSGEWAMFRARARMRRRHECISAATHHPSSRASRAPGCPHPFSLRGCTRRRGYSSASGQVWIPTFFPPITVAWTRSEVLVPFCCKISRRCFGSGTERAICHLLGNLYAILVHEPHHVDPKT